MMGRAPLQILVVPYTRDTSGSILYGVLCRSDNGQWQGVAGGGQDDETPEQAAIRETQEELNLSCPQLLPLDSFATVPAAHFAQWSLWRESKPDLYVIPEYAFGVQVEDPTQVVLSREHTQIQWLPYIDARSLLTWDSNRTALWELNQRLLHMG
jgi:dATP pyrophosphohydrolase